MNEKDLMRQFAEKQKQDSIKKKQAINADKNIVSIIFKALAIAALVIGFVMAADMQEDSIWLVFILGALGIYAVAEIIQILHDIRQGIWNHKD